MGRLALRVGLASTDAVHVTTVPPLSRLLDRATGVAGLLVLGAAAALPGSLPPLFAWLALPVVVVAGRRPLQMPTTSNQSLVVGLDSVLLVLLGLTLPVRQAMVVWAVSVLVGECTTKRTVDTRLFNSGVCILAGALALGILAPVPDAARTAPLGLVVTFVAAAVYFAFDYGWSAVSVAVAESLPLRETLQASGMLVALACFLAVDSLGFLAAVVLHEQQWTVVLLALPFVALVLSTHAWSSLRQVEHRSAVLSAAAVALQHAASTAEVEALVLEHAPVLVRAPAATWAQAGDGAGLPFVAGGVCRDLLITARVTGDVLTPTDLESLRMLLGVAEQAHERLCLLDELRRSASHDPLTGLANRTVLRDELAAAVRGEEGLAVLYCDLDGFKRLNDTRGHAVGDELLVQVAARLATSLRPQDLPVRMGGDEFAVLLRGLPAVDAVLEAHQVAERLRSALSQPYDLAGGPALVSASIGICVRTGDERPEDLLGGSDAAMYAAKAEGGGRVRLHVQDVLAL